MCIKGHNAIPVNFPVRVEPKQRVQSVNLPAKRIEIREYSVRVRILSIGITCLYLSPEVNLKLKIRPLPCPSSTELAIYLGYLRAGWLGWWLVFTL